MALGVRRGMPLGTAHRLAPEALFLDPDPVADAAAIEARLRAARGVQSRDRRETDPADPAFGRLEVQLDGLERLWGPEPDARRADPRGARRRSCRARPGRASPGRASRRTCRGRRRAGCRSTR